MIRPGAACSSASNGISARSMHDAALTLPPAVSTAIQAPMTRMNRFSPCLFLLLILDAFIPDLPFDIVWVYRHTCLVSTHNHFR